ncbi:PREDICTED: transcription initiation factor TFIID subunit 7 isoform X1 [Ceratosolen solmsi marchali]|uniref:Transcription initiation factor TFIID subunit 7 isoform X1 n=1 Tax=Ceratosolen solmsi marchali TaxID=326594 RepID=A0AAJ6YW33_9HYME|nr:PREDICTED: transcription initiation factor TFIID subunit 7 isoform X1 [Ceratosolen solmsi marchali]
MHKYNTDIKNRTEPQIELESQFIMRLPLEPSKILKETLRNGLPLKDRLYIKLENDMRYGEVRLDHWLLHAKIVDLPTIVESLKTIDNKSFYKTADICQILICKEEDDQTTDEESPIRQKKKDPTKVDKKFLWPHGITPPTKNVRRRRFRKTLKKKYVEAPEIEKEVKRLLRIDNDAVNVKWEVICEDEDQSKPNIVSSSGTVKGKRENLSDPLQSVDVAEHDIFGEAVSDSEEDDEEANINVMELDENSHLSVDSRVSDSNSIQVGYSEQSANVLSTNSGSLVTEFSKEMFESEEIIEDIKIDIEDVKIPKIEGFDDYEISENLSESQNTMINKDSIQARREQLQTELAVLQEQRRQQEGTVGNIENMKLRERFQEIIDNFLSQEAQKIQELNELELEDVTNI